MTALTEDRRVILRDKGRDEYAWRDVHLKEAVNEVKREIRTALPNLNDIFDGPLDAYELLDEIIDRKLGGALKSTERDAVKELGLVLEDAHAEILEEDLHL